MISQLFRFFTVPGRLGSTSIEVLACTQLQGPVLFQDPGRQQSSRPRYGSSTLALLADVRIGLPKCVHVDLVSRPLKTSSSLKGISHKPQAGNKLKKCFPNHSRFFAFWTRTTSLSNRPIPLLFHLNSQFKILSFFFCQGSMNGSGNPSEKHVMRNLSRTCPGRQGSQQQQPVCLAVVKLGMRTLRKKHVPISNLQSSTQPRPTANACSGKGIPGQWPIVITRSSASSLRRVRLFVCVC